MPGASGVEFGLLQTGDPVISEILPFWKRKAPPRVEEWQRMSMEALKLLWQRDRLVERDGILYRRVQCPDGGEEVLQLLLPAALNLLALSFCIFWLHGQMKSWPFYGAKAF